MYRHHLSFFFLLQAENEFFCLFFLTGFFENPKMSQQPIDTNCMTITRFVLAEQRKFPEAHGDLSQLLTSIQSAVKVLTSLDQLLL
jgi:hypothetical protein